MPLIERIGDGRVLMGALDQYQGQQLTWTMIGRPDLQTVAGQTVQTAYGPRLIPLRPPQPGPRHTDGRVYGAIPRS